MSDTVYVNGEGKSVFDRQTYTDGSDTFRGTKHEALQHYRSMYPSSSIIITTQPKKREKRLI